MSVYRIPPGVRAETLTVPTRLEQTWLDRLADYGPDMMAYWGGYDRLQSFPVDELTAASRVVIAEDVIDDRFRREWIVPQGIVDLVGLPHARTPSLRGSIVFARHESIGVATDTDLATLRLIAPHIWRAVEISNLLDMKPIEASTFAATLETLASVSCWSMPAAPSYTATPQRGQCLRWAGRRGPMASGSSKN